MKKKRFDAINTRLVIIAIAIVVMPVVCVMFILDEMKARTKKMEDALAQIQKDVKENTTWVDIYWGRIGYILEKMENKRPTLKQSEISIWDLLYCGYHPNDYNFYIKAIIGNNYVWYKNPLTKSMEEMEYQDIVNEDCYIAAPANSMGLEKE